MKSERRRPSGLLLAILAVTTALTACDDFVLRTLMEGEHGSAWAGPLRISPATVTVLQSSTITFTASGGGGGYSYSVVTALGGAVNNATGAYSAAAVAGTEVIRVTDKVGATSEATVTVTGGSPNYSVASATFPGPGTGNTGFAGDFVINNISTDAGIAAIAWRLYRSSDPTVDPGDTIVAAGTHAALPGLGSTAPVPFAGTWPSTGGPWRLIVEIAADDDSSTANNRLASAVIPVTDAPPADVDYTVTAVNNTGPMIGGGPLAGTFTFKNNGADNGSQNVHWTAHISADVVWDAADAVVDADVSTPLNAGITSGPIGFSGIWPAGATTWYLIVKVAASDDVAAGNNWTSSAPVAVTNPPVPDVDYTIFAVINAGGTTAGAALSATFTFHNNGTTAGSQPVPWTAYVSADTVLDGSDPVVDADTAIPLGAGGTSLAIPFDGTWPSLTGSYYLILKVSALEDVSGVNNSGNSVAIPITGPAPPNVDYDVTALNNIGGTVGNGPINGNFTAQNIGTTGGGQTVYWTAYVSADVTLGGGDTVIDSGSFGALGASGSTGLIPFTGTWPLTGPRYLIVQLAATDDVSTPNNVQASGAIPLTPPQVDYIVTSVSNTGGTTAGAALNGQFSMMNNAASNGSRTVFWEVYVSLDATLDGSDVIKATGSLAGLTGFGAAGPILFSGTWPAASGSYYLIVHLSAEDDINGGNNNGATAGPVVITQPDVNYQVNSVNNIGGAYTSGQLHGQFQVQNIGTANGASALYWTAYRSLDATLQIGTDIVVDAGANAALNAGNFTMIDFYDTWPSTPGAWYLIVQVQAADDPVSGNNTLASGSVGVTYPPVNYQVNSVNNVGGTLTNGTLHGQFQLQNVGTQNGAAVVSWTAYRSLNATLEIGTDIVVDAGTNAALNAGNFTVIDFWDTWPSAPGTWYLIVQVQAADDTTPGNNWFASSSVGVTNPSVDYQALSATYVGGFTVPTATVNGNFTFKNNGADDGTQLVDYLVYASLDATLDAMDVLVSAATTSPLNGGATSSPIPFSGTWPLTYGNYYLIVKLSCPEDLNGVNDKVATGATVAVGIFAESEPNDNLTTFVDADDFLSAAGVVLRPGLSIKITGAMGSGDLDDVFAVNTGTAASITASWTVQFNNRDMGLYYYINSSTFIGYSLLGDPARDNLTMTWTVDTPGVMRWIDLYNYNTANLGNWTCIITAN